MPTRIFFQKVLQTDGQARLDLKLDPLPKNFVGLAFDLVFEDKQIPALFEKFEAGPYFNFIKEDQQPLFLVKKHERDGKLIFGLTLKGNDLAKLGNGELGSFYFSKDFAADLKLENQVLSVLEKSGRKDLTGVVWETEVGVTDLNWRREINLTAKGKSGGAQEGAGALGTLESNLDQFYTDMFEGNSIDYGFYGSILLVIVLVTGLIWLILKKWRAGKVKILD
jgi:hypothetical protein